MGKVKKTVSFSPSVDLERYEAKYIIPYQQIQPIQDFIQPFCVPDLHCEAESNEYLITTLQLDTPDLALYKAKDDEALARFKLRVRTYGTGADEPVFLEIKRKIKDVIVKSRSAISPEMWPLVAESLSRRRLMNIPFRRMEEEHNYINYFRLVDQLGAKPVVLLRYKRRAYLGKNERYSRVTFDRQMCYQPQRDWNLFPDNSHWWSMDGISDIRRPYSAAILELKTYSDVPLWMVDMTQRFNLNRVGFSKYYTAVRKELMFNAGYVL